MNAVDAASPFLLAQAVQQQTLGSYACRHVILRTGIATLDEARQLGTLIDGGTTLWCCDQLPEEWLALEPSEDLDVRQWREFYRRAADRGRVRNVSRQSWRQVVGRLQSVRWPKGAKLSFQHRRVDGADIYFVSSWEQPFDGEVTFPSTNRIPELWDADTGTIHAVSDYRTETGRTIIPLRLETNESQIVVFAP